MIGMGSINRVIPSWLQSILLGQGDPKEASYESETVKAYARKTAGVVNPDAFLDYGDTFLDEEHLRTSFADTNVTVDGREEFSKESDAPRCNYRVRMLEKGGKRIMDAVSYPFPQGISGNPVRFTPRQVQAIRSGLSPGLSIVVGPPGTGKTDVAVQIIASLYHSFPTQRTVIITHSNAALNDIFQKVMARGDVEERYLLRLGSGERELQVESTHDFTKVGRVAYSFARRGVLLEKVQVLSESLGLSGRAERGADGSPSYTCETAEYFQKHQVQRRRNEFERSLKESNITTDHADVSSVFPFAAYFEAYDKPVTLAQAREYFDKLDAIFSELAEYRPLELLRSQRQRSDYLIMKQARIVAMTCTHAAISRSHLIKLGFEYDNVVVEEAGQMLEIEAFIPLLLQRGEIESSRGRLKRVCLMGDHNQLPPVIQNLTIARYCNLDQSLFSRLIRLGVPYIQFDKQGRARPEIASLYSWRYENLGNLDQVLNSGEFGLANPAFAHTFQIINVEDFQGRGESSPTSYFYQNVGEAEYVVALFQYMVLIGYSPRKISILTTYNGQRELIGDVLSQRCGEGTPLAGVRPRVVSTVDQYQGQQNDFVLLSLVRTESVGHLRDVRRLVVAVSRARLGLYVFCRQELFSSCHELKQTFDQFAARPNKLQLVLGENYPSERKVADEIPKDKLYEIDDVAHLGSVVHQMQEDWIKAQT
jgi:intron-binding protein aquarius